ncbi:MAG: 50S ribosomal protein L7Ae [Promethearchaeota archaeon]
MSKQPFYVKYESPEGLEDEALAILEYVSSEPKNIRKGTNEATKAIERGEAKLVYLSLDVDPPEIVAHLPLLCEEKKIPYVYVASKKTLGRAAGIGVTCAACAIVAAGDAKRRIEKIEERVKELTGI